MPITISGSTGIAGVDGSAATPAVQGTDANTGVVFPAADTVSISTGGSERMRVDSSGNVEIGTSTNSVYDNVASARPLVVQSSSSATTVGSSTNSITICNSDTTTNNVSQINFAAITGASANQYSSAWIAAIHGARVNGQYPAGQLVFATSTSTNNAPSEKMRIDSVGRVTMPYQPIFMGYPTTDYSGGGMPTGVIAFTVTYNNGSYYSTGTSRFTAPVAGWYRITWGGLQLPNTVTSLQVNGSDVNNGNHFAGSQPNYTTVTQTAIRYLNANDYLTIRGWNGGGYYAAWYLWTVDLIA